MESTFSIYSSLKAISFISDCPYTSPEETYSTLLHPQLFAYSITLFIPKKFPSIVPTGSSEYALGCIFKDWHPKKNVELINKIKKQLSKTQQLVETPIQYRHTKGHQKDNSDDRIFRVSVKRNINVSESMQYLLNEMIRVYVK